MEKEERKKVKLLSQDLEELRDVLSIEKKRQETVELQKKMSAPSFWSDREKAKELIEKLKDIKNDVETWDELKKEVEEIKEIILLEDESYQKEIEKEIKRLEEKLKEFKIKVFFQGRFDEANAILEINAGAGGTEACDWAEMLFRMYFRWAENKKFKLEVANEVRGEEVGIKNITFFIQGRRAYGLLKGEKGVHRLVRISPFDANRRRHTSFASVDVIPEIKEEGGIEINPDDLKIETYRASGHGGQHVNVTDSAVRITHIPTGITVSCQNERSQYQNKQIALKILRAKLFEFKEQERKKELEKLYGEKKRIEWGNQVRSYVLYPYLLVKDHRTEFQTSNAKEVLDGDIDGFIYEYLKKQGINRG